MAGCSFAATLADADAPSTHREQYYEMHGHRGYYRDGWEVVTLPPPDDLLRRRPLGAVRPRRSTPPSCVDLAGEHPDRVAELVDAWEQAAWANQVFPLDEGTYVKHLIRPPGTDRFARAGHAARRARRRSSATGRSSSSPCARSASTSRSTTPPATQGMLVAHGDQGGGYALYVEDDELRWVHNDGRGSTRTLAGRSVAGRAGHRRRRRHARRAADGGTSPLPVDGEPRAEGDGFALLFPMAPFEGIDVGIDRRSPVSWDLYERHGPFPYRGALESVTYAPGEPAPDSPYVLIDMLRELGANFE